jgi:hypothetical protein
LDGLVVDVVVVVVVVFPGRVEGDGVIDRSCIGVRSILIKSTKREKIGLLFFFSFVLL